MLKTESRDIKYYRQLDKKIEFINLTFDKMFKAVFMKNKDILKRFLILQLNLNM